MVFLRQMYRPLVRLIVCAGGLLTGAVAVGAPSGAPAPITTPAPAVQPAGDTLARRRREVDELQRQDVAAALAQLGVAVDWRTTSLEQLLDMRLRAAKAAELRARYGITVDWRRYSWERLEGVRRTLAGMEAPAAPAPRRAGGGDDVMRPTFAARPARRSTAGDPDAVLTPTFAAHPAPPPVVWGDPDAVLSPTFASRLRWPTPGQDPDGLISPTFAAVRRAPGHASSDPDALIAPLF